MEILRQSSIQFAVAIFINAFEVCCAVLCYGRQTL